MILQVPRLVEQFLGRDFPARAATVIRVETTQPVYLVFYGSADPALAVRFGSYGLLARAHDAQRELHRRRETLVPESLILCEFQEGTWLHIQRGASGTPWFALRHVLRTREDWQRVINSALATLRTFQQTVAEVPDWVDFIDPAETLASTHDRLMAIPGISAQTHARIALAVDRLRACGTLRWTWQHGDYCLNNLLFQQFSATIIDFEEFGATLLPLFDEFSLALSLHTLMPDGLKSALSDHLAACVEPALQRAPWLRAHTDDLFLVHLAIRLVQCSERPNRGAMTRALACLLEQQTGRGGRLSDTFPVASATL